MTSINKVSEPDADRFRIILRYGLDPENALNENLKQLERFIRQSKIDEVMFLLMPEERSSGHPTAALSRPWVDAIHEAKEMFARYNVATSLNPWTTTYHTGRGRRLHEGQDFRLMVGETGATNGMTACPLCENWQRYLSNYFAFLVREIEPVALWVEDDWRLHNHGGELGYGGCFCAHCLERFGAMVGRESVSREEVLASVTAPGAPHPWRTKWLELSRQSLQEPAEHLVAALQAVAPGIRIGLMSSIPDIHSIENRDWNALMRTFTDPADRYLIRPHMPPYTEEPPISTTPGYSRQTIANLDRDADIYPELENSPRSGPYSGSHSYSIWQIYNAIFYGARGITINHFDNMGMNTYYDRGMGQSLGQQRPFFDALMDLHLDDRRARGVQILFSPEVAAHKQTGGAISQAAKMYTGEDPAKFAQEGGSLNELYADSIAWSRLFYVLGISHGFTRTIEEEGETIYAVSDQTLRCFSDREIERLLGQRVLLDLPSVEILVERGFGGLVGVESVDRVRLEEAAYSVEEIEPGLLSELDGGLKARMCAQRCANPIGRFVYCAAVDVLSTIKDASLSPQFPGSGIYRNELGGWIHTSCYTLGGDQFYMAYFNRVRQEYWANVLFRMSGKGSCQSIASGHPLHVHAHDIEGGISVAVTNVIYDPTAEFELWFPVEAVEGKVVRVLNEVAEWLVIEPIIDVAGYLARIKIDWRLAPLESLVVTLLEK